MISRTAIIKDSKIDPQITQIFADYEEMKDQGTNRIIGAAMEVHKVVGCGFLDPQIDAD